MPWPFCASQQTQPSADARKPPAKAAKRVSFAPTQPTKCPRPPPQPLKPAMKQVRFTPDTKPGSQRSHARSADSEKTHFPPASSRKTTSGPGLSSVRRDFATKKSAPPPMPRKKADAQISIPAHGGSYRGPPKERHRRPGYEWVSYEVRVTPTGRVKS